MMTAMAAAAVTVASTIELHQIERTAIDKKIISPYIYNVRRNIIKTGSDV